MNSRTLALRLSWLLLALPALWTAPPAHSAGGDRIIVSGASGQLGTLTVRALLARGVPADRLILVSRTPEKLQEFAKLGASTRYADFAKPESLPAAYAGGMRMLLISIGGGAGPRPQAHRRAIEAAIAAGVKQIAYTSWVGVSRGETTGLAADHYQTEQILKQSGVAWTMLAVLTADLLFTGLTSYHRYGEADREWSARAAGLVPMCTLPELSTENAYPVRVCTGRFG